MNRLCKLVLPLAIFLLIIQSVGASSYCSGGVVQLTAPWYCDQINQALANYWAQWSPIAILAVLVSFSIASVLFGAGIFLRSDRIKNFGIGEYYEALASTIIIGGFLFLSAVMFGLIPGITTGPINPYVTSLNYIGNTIGSMHNELNVLFNIASVDGFWSSITLTVASPIFNYGASSVTHQLFQNVMFTLFYIPAMVLIELQLDILALLYAEFWIILLFMYVSIPVLLVPGVILRSLIPTRGLGGMMIATAIGFYLVLPLLFSVAYYFTNTTLQQEISANTAALQQYGSGIGAQTNALSPNSPLVETLNSIQISMDAYWLSALFYPSLIMALTYAIIIQIAEFIGGMAQLSGKVRV